MPLALRPDHGCPNSLFKLSTRSSRPMLCQAVEAAATCWESIKKWVLKPHCGLGSRVKQPCIPRIGDWFPHAPVGANLGKTLSAG
jgi:hypothetical protein